MIRRTRLSMFAALGLLLVLLAAGCGAPPDREAALRALARWEDARYADPDSLAGLLASPDAHLRRAALRAGGLIGRAENLRPMLAGLDDRSDAVREAAAVALGFLGRAEAAAPLIEALPAAHRPVRLAILEALARLPHDGRSLVEPALHGDEPEAVRAWNALRDRAAEADHGLLVQTIRSGLVRPEIDVLWRVLRCAERAPDSTLATLMAPFATHRDVQVRVHACRALGAQPESAVVEALTAVLDGADDLRRFDERGRARLRVAACRAAGALGAAYLAREDDPDPDLIDRLTRLLTAGARDQDPGVARTALAAVETLVADLPAVPESADRESLLPAWRIRLLQAARAMVRRSDLEPAVRADAVTGLIALRGPGVLRDPAWRETDLDHPLVTAAAYRALGRYAVWPALFDLPGEGRFGLMPPPLRVAFLEGHAAALRRFAAEGVPADSLAGVTRALTGLLAVAAVDSDFTVAATAAGLLGGFPAPRSLAVLCDAWDAADGEGAADIRRSVLGGIAALFAGEDPLTADVLPDSLRERAAALLGAGFDADDLHLRLAAGEAATASELLPENLIPTEDSLRLTLPPHIRSPLQPPLALPFDAPRLRCVTGRGTLEIELDGEGAPNTCASFLALIERGYFEGLGFHRVVPDFVVQGGCPRGDGWGDPGYTLRSEWSRTPYERGVVGIAHSGKDTGGSQFFITLSPQPHLNGRYTVLGRVVAGLEVADRIQPGDTFQLEIVAE